MSAPDVSALGGQVLEKALVCGLVAGFYLVEAGDGLISCKARGVFRKREISPMVGDYVRVTLGDELGRIDEIHPRKNVFVRPPLANLDILFLVASAASPPPDTVFLDKMAVICAKKNIEPAFVFTKSDLADPEPLVRLYRKAGYFATAVAAGTDRGLAEIRREIRGRVAAFAGNSGVGKTTLLKNLSPELDLEIGEVSAKLGRGRHTTRQCRIYPLFGGYVADTPGFSSLELLRHEILRKEELAGLFREFEPYPGHCRFHSCMHLSEPDCAVRRAAETGEIAESRYRSYRLIYDEIKDLKEWQLK